MKLSRCLSKPNHWVRLFVVLCFWLGMGCVGASDRVALVIGNSAYLRSPLVNPRNDASAMAALLTKAGFTVDTQLDADLPKMQTAVDRFGQAIRDPNVKFGLFYYAGHGLQQDWRNYLVPVTASIRSATDVPSQTVDVSNLLRYMEQAQGRSFLVVLDACRNDPFAGAFRPVAKGLSQFDAPVGSLLAYATSPGNVAQDGEGVNGLYTGYLLREFAVPGARLEDAFKRVRLNVRMASNGEQIPWESTSLEEDLYLFPTVIHKLTEDERDQLLEKEMNTWLRVKTSTDPRVLAEFIREYPSGSASELAQSRMNRMLKVMADEKSHQTQEQTQKAAAKDLAAKEEEARRLAALAEEKRLQALRAEEDRVRIAKLEAAKEEEHRQQAAQEAAATAERARLEQAKAQAAEQESLRLAAAQKEAERLQQLQVQAAAAELERAQALAQQKSARERELAHQAELARIEQERLAELQQREADRLAAEKASQQAQERQRLLLAQAQSQRLEAERAETERVRLAKLEAEQAEQRRLLAAKETADRAEAARLAQEQALLKEQQAQRLAAAQQEAARLSQIQAQAAAAELLRVQAEQAEKERGERELAAKAERERLELARMADMQKQQADRLAAQKQTLLAAASAVPSQSASLDPTPYFKGYNEHQRQFSVGDEAQIQVIDIFTKATKTKVMKVTQVDLPNERVIYNDGAFASDLMGNTTTNLRGSFSTPRQFYPADLMVGKKWQTRFKQSRSSGLTYTFQYDLKVVAKEKITVPAGTFDAYKIEARGFNMELGASIERNIWVAPGVNADIAHEIKVRLRNGRMEQADREELVSFAQARR